MVATSILSTNNTPIFRSFLWSANLSSKTTHINSHFSKFLNINRAIQFNKNNHFLLQQSQKQAKTKNTVFSTKNPFKNLTHISRRFYGTSLEEIQKAKEILKEKYYFLPKLPVFLKGFRPSWTLDDITAMFSFLLIGNALFIIVGTTTFVSLVLFLANTLQFQEFLATQVEKYLTKETGIQISFESAIVPNWKQGTLLFRNVKAKRKIASDQNGFLLNQNFDYKNLPQFELEVREVEVMISIAHFWKGKGLVQECKIQGMKGTIDYRECDWSAREPKREKRQPGDFELKKLIVEDSEVRLEYPNFNPYYVSVINLDANLFRKQWLIYDLLCADSFVGIYDGCLFSLHPPSKHKKDQRSIDHSSSPEKKFREVYAMIHNVPFRHFNANTEGPLSWISTGTVSTECYINLPIISDESDNFLDMLDRIGFINAVKNKILGKTNEEEIAEEEKGKYVTFDFSFKFQNIKAEIPLNPPNYSFIDSNLYRPLVAFLNANSSRLQTTCKVSLELEKFDGGGNLYDCELTLAIQRRLLENMIILVNHRKKRSQRIKKFILWSVGYTAENITSLWKRVYSAEKSPDLFRTLAMAS